MPPSGRRASAGRADCIAFTNRSDLSVDLAQRTCPPRTYPNILLTKCLFNPLFAPITAICRASSGSLYVAGLQGPPGIFDSPLAQWFHGNEPDIFTAGLAQHPAAGHFRIQQAHRQLDGVEKIELERLQAIVQRVS